MGKAKKVGIGIGIAFFALIVISVVIASLDNPELEQVEIRLANVELGCLDTIKDRAGLETIFLVKNPSNTTITVPLISYELFADGNSLGRGQYSTEDIPFSGRVAFYPGYEVPLNSLFVLVESDSNANRYRPIVNGDPVNYSAEGVMTIESAWSIIEKEFKISDEQTPVKYAGYKSSEECQALITPSETKTDKPSESMTKLPASCSGVNSMELDLYPTGKQCFSALNDRVEEWCINQSKDCVTQFYLKLADTCEDPVLSSVEVCLMYTFKELYPKLIP